MATYLAPTLLVSNTPIDFTNDTKDNILNNYNSITINTNSELIQTIYFYYVWENQADIPLYNYNVYLTLPYDNPQKLYYTDASYNDLFNSSLVLHKGVTYYNTTCYRVQDPLSNSGDDYTAIPQSEISVYTTSDNEPLHVISIVADYICIETSQSTLATNAVINHVSNSTDVYTNAIELQFTGGYVISFNCNGGTSTAGSTISKYFNAGDVITAPSVNPSRSSTTQYTYTFAGWGASSTSTTVITSFGTATADGIYYAIWTKTTRSYVVTWTKSGSGTLSNYSPSLTGTNTVTVDYGTSVSCTATPSTGYHITVTGASNSSGTISATITGTTTIAVAFVINSWTATFKAVNGTFSDGTTTKTVTYNYGATISYPSVTPNTHYTTGSWSPSYTTMPNGNTTFTYTCVVKSVSVTASAGSNATISTALSSSTMKATDSSGVTVTFGPASSSYLTPTTVTVKAGSTTLSTSYYSFSSGKVTLYTSIADDYNGQTVTITSGAAGKKVYAITLSSSSTKSCTAGTSTIYEWYGQGWYSNAAVTSSISSITLPSKTGYTFGGFYKETGLSNQVINASGSITAGNTTFSTNATIYNKFTANAVKITIKHYIQSLDAAKLGNSAYGTSYYSIETTDTSQTATADSTITIVNYKKTIEGFTYSGGQVNGSTVTTTAVNAAGTTIINLYYTRNSHTFTWIVNTNSGNYNFSDLTITGSYSPANNSTVFYGDTITTPTELSLTGYRFQDYSSVYYDGTSSTSGPITLMPDRDASICANFNAINIQIIVNQYAQTITAAKGGSTAYGTTNYTLMLTEYPVTQIADATINLSDYVTNEEGYTYSGGQVNGTTVTTTTVLPDGTRVIDLYYTRNQYTLTLAVIYRNSTNTATVAESDCGAFVTLDAYDSDTAGTPTVDNVDNNTANYYYGETLYISHTTPLDGTWTGWSTSNTTYTASTYTTMPASDLTIYGWVTNLKHKMYCDGIYLYNTAQNTVLIAGSSTNNDTTTTTSLPDYSNISSSSVTAVECGSTAAAITAPDAPTGFKWWKWSDGTTTQTHPATTIKSDKPLKAYYYRQTYAVTISARFYDNAYTTQLGTGSDDSTHSTVTGASGGTVSQNVEYNCGITLTHWTPTNSDAFSWKQWTLGTSTATLSNDGTGSLTSVTDNVTLYADFIRQEYQVTWTAAYGTGSFTNGTTAVEYGLTGTNTWKPKTTSGYYVYAVDYGTAEATYKQNVGGVAGTGTARANQTITSDIVTSDLMVSLYSANTYQITWKGYYTDDGTNYSAGNSWATTENASSWTSNTITSYVTYNTAGTMWFRPYLYTTSHNTYYAVKSDNTAATTGCITTTSYDTSNGPDHTARNIQEITSITVTAPITVNVYTSCVYRFWFNIPNATISVPIGDGTLTTPESDLPYYEVGNIGTNSQAWTCADIYYTPNNGYYPTTATVTYGISSLNTYTIGTDSDPFVTTTKDDTANNTPTSTARKEQHLIFSVMLCPCTINVTSSNVYTIKWVGDNGTFSSADSNYTDCVYGSTNITNTWTPTKVSGQSYSRYYVTGITNGSAKYTNTAANATINYNSSVNSRTTANIITANEITQPFTVTVNTSDTYNITWTGGTGSWTNKTASATYGTTNATAVFTPTNGYYVTNCTNAASYSKTTASSTDNNSDNTARNGQTIIAITIIQPITVQVTTNNQYTVLFTVVNGAAYFFNNATNTTNLGVQITKTVTFEGTTSTYLEPVAGYYISGITNATGYTATKSNAIEGCYARIRQQITSISITGYTYVTIESSNIYKVKYYREVYNNTHTKTYSSDGYDEWIPDSSPTATLTILDEEVTYNSSSTSMEIPIYSTANGYHQAGIAVTPYENNTEHPLYSTKGANYYLYMYTGSHYDSTYGSYTDYFTSNCVVYRDSGHSNAAYYTYSDDTATPGAYFTVDSGNTLSAASSSNANEWTRGSCYLYVPNVKGPMCINISQQNIYYVYVNHNNATISHSSSELPDNYYCVEWNQLSAFTLTPDSGYYVAGSTNCEPTYKTTKTDTYNTKGSPARSAQKIEYCVGTQTNSARTAPTTPAAAVAQFNSTTVVSFASSLSSQTSLAVTTDNTYRIWYTLDVSARGKIYNSSSDHTVVSYKDITYGHNTSIYLQLLNTANTIETTKPSNGWYVSGIANGAGSTGGITTTTSSTNYQPQVITSNTLSDSAQTGPFTVTISTSDLYKITLSGTGTFYSGSDTSVTSDKITSNYITVNWGNTAAIYFTPTTGYYVISTTDYPNGAVNGTVANKSTTNVGCNPNVDGRTTKNTVTTDKPSAHDGAFTLTVNTNNVYQITWNVSTGATSGSWNSSTTTVSYNKSGTNTFTPNTTNGYYVTTCTNTLNDTSYSKTTRTASDNDSNNAARKAQTVTSILILQPTTVTISAYNIYRITWVESIDSNASTAGTGAALSSGTFAAYTEENANVKTAVSGVTVYDVVYHSKTHTYFTPGTGGFVYNVTNGTTNATSTSVFNLNGYNSLYSTSSTADRRIQQTITTDSIVSPITITVHTSNYYVVSWTTNNAETIFSLKNDVFATNYNNNTITAPAALTYAQYNTPAANITNSFTPPTGYYVTGVTGGSPAATTTSVDENNTSNAAARKQQTITSTQITTVAITITVAVSNIYRIWFNASNGKCYDDSSTSTECAHKDTSKSNYYYTDVTYGSTGDIYFEPNNGYYVNGLTNCLTNKATARNTYPNSYNYISYIADGTNAYYSTASTDYSRNRQLIKSCTLADSGTDTITCPTVVTISTSNTYRIYIQTYTDTSISARSKSNTGGSFAETYHDVTYGNNYQLTWTPNEGYYLYAISNGIYTTNYSRNIGGLNTNNSARKAQTITTYTLANSGTNTCSGSFTLKVYCSNFYKVTWTTSGSGTFTNTTNVQGSTVVQYNSSGTNTFTPTLSTGQYVYKITYKGTDTGTSISETTLLESNYTAGDVSKNNTYGNTTSRIATDNTYISASNANAARIAQTVTSVTVSEPITVVVYTSNIYRITWAGSNGNYVANTTGFTDYTFGADAVTNTWTPSTGYFVYAVTYGTHESKATISTIDAIANVCTEENSGRKKQATITAYKVTNGQSGYSGPFTVTVNSNNYYAITWKGQGTFNDENSSLSDDTITVVQYGNVVTNTFTPATGYYTTGISATATSDTCATPTIYSDSSRTNEFSTSATPYFGTQSNAVASHESRAIQYIYSGTIKSVTTITVLTNNKYRIWFTGTGKFYTNVTNSTTELSKDTNHSNNYYIDDTQWTKNVTVKFTPTEGYYVTSGTHNYATVTSSADKTNATTGCNARVQQSITSYTLAASGTNTITGPVTVYIATSNLYQVTWESNNGTFNEYTGSDKNGTTTTDYYIYDVVYNTQARNFFTPNTGYYVYKVDNGTPTKTYINEEGGALTTVVNSSARSKQTITADAATQPMTVTVNVNNIYTITWHITYDTNTLNNGVVSASTQTTATTADYGYFGNTTSAYTSASKIQYQNDAASSVTFTPATGYYVYSVTLGSAQYVYNQHEGGITGNNTARASQTLTSVVLGATGNPDGPYDAVVHVSNYYKITWESNNTSGGNFTTTTTVVQYGTTGENSSWMSADSTSAWQFTTGYYVYSITNGVFRKDGSATKLTLSAIDTFVGNDGNNVTNVCTKENNGRTAKPIFITNALNGTNNFGTTNFTVTIYTKNYYKVTFAVDAVSTGTYKYNAMAIVYNGTATSNTFTPTEGYYTITGTTNATLYSDSDKTAQLEPGTSTTAYVNTESRKTQYITSSTITTPTTVTIKTSKQYTVSFVGEGKFDANDTKQTAITSKIYDYTTNTERIIYFTPTTGYYVNADPSIESTNDAIDAGLTNSVIQQYKGSYDTLTTSNQSNRQIITFTVTEPTTVTIATNNQYYIYWDVNVSGQGSYAHGTSIVAWGSTITNDWTPTMVSGKTYCQYYVYGVSNGSSAYSNTKANAAISVDSRLNKANTITSVTPQSMNGAFTVKVMLSNEYQVTWTGNNGSYSEYTGSDRNGTINTNYTVYTVTYGNNTKNIWTPDLGYYVYEIDSENLDSISVILTCSDYTITDTSKTLSYQSKTNSYGSTTSRIATDNITTNAARVAQTIMSAVIIEPVTITVNTSDIYTITWVVSNLNGESNTASFASPTTIVHYQSTTDAGLSNHLTMTAGYFVYMIENGDCANATVTNSHGYDGTSRQFVSIETDINAESRKQTDDATANIIGVDNDESGNLITGPFTVNVHTNDYYLIYYAVNTANTGEFTNTYEAIKYNTVITNNTFTPSTGYYTTNISDNAELYHESDKTNKLGTTGYEFGTQSNAMPDAACRATQHIKLKAVTASDTVTIYTNNLYRIWFTGAGTYFDTNNNELSKDTNHSNNYYLDGNEWNTSTDVKFLATSGYYVVANGHIYATLPTYETGVAYADNTNAYTTCNARQRQTITTYIIDGNTNNPNGPFTAFINTDNHYVVTWNTIWEGMAIDLDTDLIDSEAGTFANDNNLYTQVEYYDVVTNDFTPVNGTTVTIVYADGTSMNNTMPDCGGYVYDVRNGTPEYTLLQNKGYNVDAENNIIEYGISDNEARNTQTITSVNIVEPTDITVYVDNHYELQYSVDNATHGSWATNTVTALYSTIKRAINTFTNATSYYLFKLTNAFLNDAPTYTELNKDFDDPYDVEADHSHGGKTAVATETIALNVSDLVNKDNVNPFNVVAITQRIYEVEVLVEAENGTIHGSADPVKQLVDYGGTGTITITANAGYYIHHAETSCPTIDPSLGIERGSCSITHLTGYINGQEESSTATLTTHKIYEDNDQEDGNPIIVYVRPKQWIGIIYLYGVDNNSFESINEESISIESIQYTNGTTTFTQSNVLINRFIGRTGVYYFTLDEMPDADKVDSNVIITIHNLNCSQYGYGANATDTFTGLDQYNAFNGDNIVIQAACICTDTIDNLSSNNAEDIINPMPNITDDAGDIIDKFYTIILHKIDIRHKRIVIQDENYDCLHNITTSDSPVMALKIEQGTHTAHMGDNNAEVTINNFINTTAYAYNTTITINYTGGTLSKTVTMSEGFTWYGCKNSNPLGSDDISLNIEIADGESKLGNSTQYNELYSGYKYDDKGSHYYNTALSCISSANIISYSDTADTNDAALNNISSYLTNYYTSVTMYKLYNLYNLMYVHDDGNLINETDELPISGCNINFRLTNCYSIISECDSTGDIGFIDATDDTADSTFTEYQGTVISRLTDSDGNNIIDDGIYYNKAINVTIALIEYCAPNKNMFRNKSGELVVCADNIPIYVYKDGYTDANNNVINHSVLCELTLTNSLAYTCIDKLTSNVTYSDNNDTILYGLITDKYSVPSTSMPLDVTLYTLYTWYVPQAIRETGTILTNGSGANGAEYQGTEFTGELDKCQIYHNSDGTTNRSDVGLGTTTAAETDDIFKAIVINSTVDNQTGTGTNDATRSPLIACNFYYITFCMGSYGANVHQWYVTIFKSGYSVEDLYGRRILGYANEGTCAWKLYPDLYISDENLILSCSSGYQVPYIIPLATFYIRIKVKDLLTDNIINFDLSDDGNPYDVYGDGTKYILVNGDITIKSSTISSLGLTTDDDLIEIHTDDDITAVNTFITQMHSINATMCSVQNNGDTYGQYLETLSDDKYYSIPFVDEVGTGYSPSGAANAGETISVAINHPGYTCDEYGQYTSGYSQDLKYYCGGADNDASVYGNSRTWYNTEYYTIGMYELYTWYVNMTVTDTYQNIHCENADIAKINSAYFIVNDTQIDITSFGLTADISSKENNTVTYINTSVDTSYNYLYYASFVTTKPSSLSGSDMYMNVTFGKTHWADNTENNQQTTESTHNISVSISNNYGISHFGYDYQYLNRLENGFVEIACYDYQLNDVHELVDNATGTCKAEQTWIKSLGYTVETVDGTDDTDTTTVVSLHNTAYSGSQPYYYTTFVILPKYVETNKWIDCDFTVTFRKNGYGNSSVSQTVDNCERSIACDIVYSTDISKNAPEADAADIAPRMFQYPTVNQNQFRYLYTLYNWRVWLYINLYGDTYLKNTTDIPVTIALSTGETLDKYITAHPSITIGQTLSTELNPVNTTQVWNAHNTSAGWYYTDFVMAYNGSEQKTGWQIKIDKSANLNIVDDSGSRTIYSDNYTTHVMDTYAIGFSDNGESGYRVTDGTRVGLTNSHAVIQGNTGGVVYYDDYITRTAYTPKVYPILSSLPAPSLMADSIHITIPADDNTDDGYKYKLITYYELYTWYIAVKLHTLGTAKSLLGDGTEYINTNNMLFGGTTMTNATTVSTDIYYKTFTMAAYGYQYYTDNCVSMYHMSANNNTTIYVPLASIHYSNSTFGGPTNFEANYNKYCHWEEPTEATLETLRTNNQLLDVYAYYIYPLYCYFYVNANRWIITNGNVTGKVTFGLENCDLTCDYDNDCGTISITYPTNIDGDTITYNTNSMTISYSSTLDHVELIDMGKGLYKFKISDLTTSAAGINAYWIYNSLVTVNDDSYIKIKHPRYYLISSNRPVDATSYSLIEKCYIAMPNALFGDVDNDTTSNSEYVSPTGDPSIPDLYDNTRKLSENTAIATMINNGYGSKLNMYTKVYAWPYLLMDADNNEPVANGNSSTPWATHQITNIIYQNDADVQDETHANMSDYNDDCIIGSAVAFSVKLNGTVIQSNNNTDVVNLHTSADGEIININGNDVSQFNWLIMQQYNIDSKNYSALTLLVQDSQVNSGGSQYNNSDYEFKLSNLSLLKFKPTVKYSTNSMLLWYEYLNLTDTLNPTAVTNENYCVYYEPILSDIDNNTRITNTISAGGNYADYSDFNKLYFKRADISSAIYVGNTPVKYIYQGITPINKLFQGNKQIYYRK